MFRTLTLITTFPSKIQTNYFLYLQETQVKKKLKRLICLGKNMNQI